MEGKKEGGKEKRREGGRGESQRIVTVWLVKSVFNQYRHKLFFPGMKTGTPQGHQLKMSA